MAPSSVAKVTPVMPGPSETSVSNGTASRVDSHDAIRSALGSAPVARSIWVSARVACEPGSSNAFDALKLPGAGPPITPTSTNSRTPSTAIRRGRAHERFARRSSMPQRRRTASPSS